MNSPVGRRIAGTATLIAVLALAVLGFEYRFARPDGSTDIILKVEEAGTGMSQGTDVKVRGVPVGQIIDVRLADDGLPRLTARLDPGVRIPTSDLNVTITPKTFFGEKQVVIDYPLEAFGEGPFLQNGDVVVATGGLTEVEDVLQTLQPLLAGIDEGDLATLFDATAALEGEGENIARNLEALSSLSLTVAAWIDVEEERLDTFLATGDVVGAFLERNVESIPSIIDGLRLFAETQSKPSPYLDDNTIYVPFKIFLDIEELARNHLGPLFDPLTSMTDAGSS